MTINDYQWWDLLKSEVKAAAKTVTRERKNERKQELSFLMIVQAHLASKVSSGDLKSLPELKLAQERITSWFENIAKEVFLHANIKEVEESEHTLIFHHEKLQTSRKRASILKLKNHQGDWSKATRDVPPFSKGRPALSLTTWPHWTPKPRMNS